MIFEGRVYKSDKSRFWLAEISALDLMTQGSSRKNALNMVQDALAGYIDRAGFKSKIVIGEGECFSAETNQDAAVIPLLLRRQRAKSGLTIRDVARLLGAKSPNSYAAYESGEREPSISKVEELLSVVSKQDRLQLKVGRSTT